MSKLKNIFYASLFVFIFLTIIFLPNTTQAYSQAMTNQVCGHNTASGYTYHCNSYVTMNIPASGYYNAGDFLDVQFWTDDYTDPMPLGSPNYVTFNSIYGTSHDCSIDNSYLPCKHWESNDYPDPDPSMYAGSNGCHYMNVWYKWGFPSTSGNYEYNVSIPYNVGPDNPCGGNGGGGNGPTPTVTATANPSTIYSGGSSEINYSSTNSVSCDIYKSNVLQAQHCPVSGLYNTGSLTNTNSSPTTYPYTITCGSGSTYTGSPVGDCDGPGGSYSINTLPSSKSNFFTQARDFFSNIPLKVFASNQDPSASANVNITVNPTPLITLTLQSGMGNDGNGKDLVKAMNKNSILGITHFVPDINGTIDGCDLYQNGIKITSSKIPNGNTVPFNVPEISEATNPTNNSNGITSGTGDNFYLQCQTVGGTITSNLKYPNGSPAVVKGQDVSGFQLGNNYSSQPQCQNPHQDQSEACCVIQKGQSSCTIPYNWTTINPLNTTNGGYQTEMKHENTSMYSSDTSNTVTNAPIPLGIGTVNTPIIYTLINKVDGESSNTTVDNPLGSKILKSECAVGLSVINGVCDEDVSNLPDLIAQNIQAPGNVEGGQTFNVTTDIKNQGNARATEDPIFVLFQATDTDPGQQQGGGNSEAYHKPNWLQEKLSWLIDGDKAEAGTVIEKTATIHGGIDAGAIKNVGVSFSFPTVGNRWIRACADKASAGDAGVVTESYENNNCSSWKKVSVGLPDLIALSTQAASTVVVNTALSVSTTVKNQGNSDVNSTFYTLFQTTTVNPNGGQGGQGQGGQGQEVSWLKKLYSSVFGLDRVIAAENTPPPLPNVINTVQIYGLDAGASITKSLSMTFSTIGDKWIRTCADKKSASDTGLIHESIEGNNCSAWIKVTVTEAIPLNSDLQAGTPTPTVAVANTPVTFSSTISNTGSESTLVSFYNLFQTKPNLLSNDITDYKTNFMMTAIPGGQSKVAQRAITFTTAGTVYMRTCADKSSQADATGLVHNESNENNNCSAWVPITILLTGSPDLTIERGVIPTSAQVGVSTTFRTTVNNIGALTTGASFPNIFQVSSNASGLGAETFSAGDLSELQAGESVALSTNYTFANEGTYYARFCTDLNTRIQGVITEENENNNCSPWTETTITKDKEQCPNGAVNWPECTLDGDGDCINGALNPPQCDEFNNTSVAQCNNSVLHGCLAGVDENHSEGQDYYYWDCRLKDSVAHCFYPKNGGVGTGNGDEGNVTLTAVPSWIFKGRISTLTWSSWSGASCSIMPGEFTGLLDNGSLQMRPSETTTYTANCTDSTNTGQASATVKVINPLIFEQ